MALRKLVRWLLQCVRGYAGVRQKGAGGGGKGNRFPALLARIRGREGLARDPSTARNGGNTVSAARLVIGDVGVGGEAGSTTMRLDIENRWTSRLVKAPCRDISSERHLLFRAESFSRSSDLSPGSERRPLLMAATS